MRILEVRERTIPLAADIRNAAIDFSTMTATLVAVETDVVRDGQRVVGYGHSSPGRYAQGATIRDRLVPRILAADPAELCDADGLLDPPRVHGVMLRSEKPGGHGERSVAAGAVDVALWDLRAKLEGLPLAELFARRDGSARAAERVWVYGAGGYYSEDGSTEALVRELGSYVEQGFAHVKMKIAGMPLAADAERVAAAVESLGGDGGRLAVDANGGPDLESALAYAEMFAPFGLLWYEEPCHPLDFAAYERVCAAYNGPIATGENLFSVDEVRNLLRYAGLRADRDYLQVDPPLAYGPTEFLRMVELGETLGWDRDRFNPHGGHQLNLALTAGLGLGGCECYPGVFKPIGGFVDHAPVVDGFVTMPDLPGIGVEAKADLWAALREV